MKILIIDNYDSFTFNLYQYTGEVLIQKRKKFSINVFRNDAITIDKVTKSNYDKIIISPGPGNPADSSYFGLCARVITHLGKTIPVLGVCLGMQGIGYCFGGKVIPAKKPMHGKSSVIDHDGLGIFKNIPQKLEVMRYHSLVADIGTLPDCLKITAFAQDTKEIMGLRHKTYPIEGVQFHPESFATEAGKMLLANFLFSTK